MSENTPLKSAIELCLAVYRITDKFPCEEILTQKIRAKSIDIIEDLVYNSSIPTNSSRIVISRDLEREIRILFAYFSVAENQDWVDARNFQVLREAYRNFYRTLVNRTGSDPDGLEVRFQEGLNTGINPGINTGIKRQTLKQRRQGRHGSRQISLTARQEKIVVFLGVKEGGQAISDIAEKIQTSNKTAERELKNLIGMGRARKQGNTRSARFLIVG